MFFQYTYLKFILIIVCAFNFSYNKINFVENWIQITHWSTMNVSDISPNNKHQNVVATYFRYAINITHLHLIGWQSNWFFCSGEDKHKYGHQRLWGSISWGIIPFLSGFCVDWYSKGQQHKDYTPCFVIASLSSLLDAYVLTKIEVNI